MINKKPLFFSALILFFLFGANFVSAAMEVNLGLKDTSLGGYAVYLFKFGVGIAGVVALISFAIGAVMLMISGDDPTLHGSAIDRMKGSILGLVLIVCSFLIIDTINPKLETFNFTPLPSVSLAPVAVPPGVYFYTQANCKGDSSVGHTSSIDDIGENGGKIQSVKIINDPASGIYYGVIFHKTTGLKNGGECNLPINGDQCVEITNYANTKAANIFIIDKNSASSGNSMTFYSEPWGMDTIVEAGYKKITATDMASPSFAYKISADQICFDYAGVKRPSKYMHKCTPSAFCQRGCNSDFDCSSGATSNTSGSLGEICKKIKVNGKDSVRGVCVADPNISECSPNACETFEDCPGSIKIDGHYLVALYSEDCWNECAESSSGSCYEDCLTGTIQLGKIIYCQTFTEDADTDTSNLNTEPIIASGNGSLNNIYIIPTK